MGKLRTPLPLENYADPGRRQGLEKVLTNKELELVDLKWDATRLNRDFRDEFTLLTSNDSLLPDHADEFCKKWGISILIDFKVSLKDLLHQLETELHPDSPVYPTPGFNETGKEAT